MIRSSLFAARAHISSLCHTFTWQFLKSFWAINPTMCVAASSCSFPGTQIRGPRQRVFGMCMSLWCQTANKPSKQTVMYLWTNKQTLWLGGLCNGRLHAPTVFKQANKPAPQWNYSWGANWHNISSVHCYEWVVYILNCLCKRSQKQSEMPKTWKSQFHHSLLLGRRCWFKGIQSSSVSLPHLLKLKWSSQFKKWALTVGPGFNVTDQGTSVGLELILKTYFCWFYSCLGFLLQDPSRPQLQGHYYIELLFETFCT